MSELATLARPYAQAAFQLAGDNSKLDMWSDMLALMSEVMGDADIVAAAMNPSITDQALCDLLLDIGGGRLSDEGQNFIRLLVENDRVTLIPEISRLFEDMKAKSQGSLDVVVRSAFAVKAAEKKQITAMLTERFGQTINVTTEKDPSLMGGAIIQAGDIVIDASVRGQLQQLSNDLGVSL